MGWAFFWGGCITFLFFEPYPYTWKGEILHSSWSLEIYLFILLKLEYIGPSYRLLGFLLHTNANSLKIPQELLV
jgi:hypothetical protein